MKKQLIRVSVFLSIFFSLVASLEASKAKPFQSEEEADCYLKLHYNRGSEYYNKEEWRSAADEFEKVIYFFPDSEEAAEAAYYLGICYYSKKEYDFANEQFSNYLKASSHPAFFEDAVYYKFCIAEHFRLGNKKRVLNARYCPKWASGQDLALSIYDEVIAALPNHELTVRSLYFKAELLRKMRQYRACIEAYQLIVRRFPKDEVVPSCYLNIAHAYALQSRCEFQNPDLLALAELNARRFKEEFPRDERVNLVENSVCYIQELYAKGLSDLGLFYERKKQPAAAAIYYQSSIEEFPKTNIAEFCRMRLEALGFSEKEAPITPENEEEAELETETDLVALLGNIPSTWLASNEGMDIQCEEFFPDDDSSEIYPIDEEEEEEELPFVHYSLLKKRGIRHDATPQQE